jgi:hypothetical protein
MCCVAEYDEERYSNVQAWDAVDGVMYRLTWRQLAEQRAEEIQRLSKWATIASDLDRCEHGRHEGDVCSGLSGCNGPSVGNRLIGHGPIGHTISGAHIFFPPRFRRHDPDEWVVGNERCSTNNGGECPIGKVRNGS